MIKKLLELEKKKKAYWALCLQPPAMWTKALLDLFCVSIGTHRQVEGAQGKIKRCITPVNPVSKTEGFGYCLKKAGEGGAGKVNLNLILIIY